MNAAKTACLRAAGCAALLLVAAAPVPAAERAGGELEEIVVQATRIPTQLRRMPFAVMRVEGERMRFGRQQLGLDEALAVVPGVFFQNRYNFAQELRISIRGFGARANFGIRGIKLFADDIPLTMPDGQGGLDSLDLGSVRDAEVIRGPMSAIYGAASGGVIALRTEDGPEQPFLSGKLSGGSYGYRFGQLKAGGQWGRLNAIANLSDMALDGYRDHSRYERTLLNSKFRHDFSGGSSLTVVFNAVDSPVSDDPGALTLAEAEADPRQAAPRNLQFDAGEALEQQKLGLAWRSDPGRDTGWLLRSYAIRRDFQNLLPFGINANGQGGSVDLDRSVGGLGGHWYWNRALGEGRENRLVIGVDFDEQRDLRTRFANVQGVPGALTTRQDEDVSSRALFLNDSWSASEQLTLVLGGRLDDMSYEATDRTGAGGSGETSFSEFSPMAGLAWSPVRALSLYANVSTSFDPPAITELANPAGPTGFNQQLGPQTATSYEVGMRGQRGERAAYELAAFHVDVSDEIVPFELTGSGQSFFQNAGASTHQGLEAAARFELVHGLTASATYTWSDFNFERFTDVGGRVYDGNRIPGMPEHQAYIDLALRLDSGFYAGWDLQYVGDFYADNANQVSTGDYLVSSLRAGFRWSGERWTLEPFAGVNNLFDETYFSNIRINAAFGRYYEPAPERNAYAGVELSCSF